MPSPEALDIEALLAPIAGDEPAGGPIPFALRERLDLARKEINPNDFDASDPMRPTDHKYADWAAIAQLTREALGATSKDLLLAARLIEAETKLRGFAGLRDGFRLVRRLVEEAWDRLRPTIEEPDDLEVRAAPLHWLDDADRGARFPNTIRSVPLIESSLGMVNWLEWNQSRAGGTSTVNTETIEKAVAATTRESCQRIADDLGEVVEELGLLLSLMGEKMGQVAPSLIQVRQAVSDCRTLAQQILQRKGPGASTGGEEGEVEASGDEATADRPAGIGKLIATRAQAYSRLIEVADALEKIEPHSPIPHVIRRAVALGQLSFPELMRELISDEAVLGDLSRNLGIKELKG